MQPSKVSLRKEVKASFMAHTSACRVTSLRVATMLFDSAIILLLFTISAVKGGSVVLASSLLF